MGRIFIIFLKSNIELQSTNINTILSYCFKCMFNVFYLLTIKYSQLLIYYTYSYVNIIICDIIYLFIKKIKYKQNMKYEYKNQIKTLIFLVTYITRTFLSPSYFFVYLIWLIIGKLTR